MGSKNELLPRWYSSLGNIKLIIQKLRKFIPEIKPNKEENNQTSNKGLSHSDSPQGVQEGSLRDAETDWSECICGEKIHHSVIHYWKKNIPAEIIENAVKKAGKELENILDYSFSIIDAASFTNGIKKATAFIFSFACMKELFIL